MEKYKLTVDEIERLKGRDQGWWAEFKRMLSFGEDETNDPKYYQVSMGDEPSLLTTDEMFRAEEQILKCIAHDESCVIAGRTAFYVLRNQLNHLNVLVQASMEHRLERVMCKQGISREEAEKVINEVDKMRENYVSRYTGTSRYDTRNYDLVVTIDGKTEEEVADLILQFIG
jgi:cytidylate kinase